MAQDGGGGIWNGALTAIRRSAGPRPGGTYGERASGTTTKILSRWSGGYWDKYGCTGKGEGGWGGKIETGTTKPRRTKNNERIVGRKTRAGNPGTRREGPPRPETEANPLARRRLQLRQGNQGHRGGAPSPKPLHQTRNKYRQPHRSGGGKPKHRGTGKDTGDAWHRASRQVRRTAGDTGAPGGYR